MPIDIAQMLYVVLAFALTHGLLKLAGAALHQIARLMRARAKATATTKDDAPLEFGAQLIDLAGDAAQRGDAEEVKSIVRSALHLPPPKA